MLVAGYDNKHVWWKIEWKTTSDLIIILGDLQCCVKSWGDDYVGVINKFYDN